MAGLYCSLGKKLYCRGSVVLQYSGVQWVQNCIAISLVGKRGIAREGVLYCNTLLEDTAGSVLQ